MKDQPKGSCHKLGYLTSTEANSLHFKPSHSHFSQIQSQMAITKTSNTDFVVWSPKDILIVAIPFDLEHWNKLLAGFVMFLRNILALHYFKMLQKIQMSTMLLWSRQLLGTPSCSSMCVAMRTARRNWRTEKTLHVMVMKAFTVIVTVTVRDGIILGALIWNCLQNIIWRIWNGYAILSMWNWGGVCVCVCYPV